jgi:hypothetical protein
MPEPEETNMLTEMFTCMVCKAVTYLSLIKSDAPDELTDEAFEEIDDAIDQFTMAFMACGENLKERRLSDLTKSPPCFVCEHYENADEDDEGDECEDVCDECRNLGACDKGHSVDQASLEKMGTEGCLDFDRDKEISPEAITQEKAQIEKDFSERELQNALYMFADMLRNGFESTGGCPVCSGKQKPKTNYCPECGNSLN